MNYLLFVLAVLARFVPHPMNFTPLGAVGLFTGANSRPVVAWGVPLAAVAIGDAVTGFYEPVVMLGVYLGFAAGPLCGRLWLAKRRSIASIGGAVLCSATAFYALSNLGVWWTFYPHTAAGLALCYVRGLPYYGVTVLGDALYAGVLFGAQALAETGFGTAPAASPAETRQA